MMRQRTVLDLKVGEEGVIRDFLDSTMACKLLTIGLVPETKVKLLRRGPFGQAVCLQLGRTYVAVRNAEARSIIIV